MVYDSSCMTCLTVTTFSSEPPYPSSVWHLVNVVKLVSFFRFFFSNPISWFSVTNGCQLDHRSLNIEGNCTKMCQDAQNWIFTSLSFWFFSYGPTNWKKKLYWWKTIKSVKKLQLNHLLWKNLLPLCMHLSKMDTGVTSCGQSQVWPFKLHWFHMQRLKNWWFC